MKKQINEIKRMQLLAGVITESEYRKSLNEAENSNMITQNDIDTLHDKGFDIITDKDWDFVRIQKMLFAPKADWRFLNNLLSSRNISADMDYYRGDGDKGRRKELEISKEYFDTNIKYPPLGSKLNESPFSISGDYNNMDFDGPEQEEASSYLETEEGKKAVSILKTLVSKKFDSDDLSNAIEKCNFEKTNYFRAAAKKAGLELEGLGTVDNKGNGDFEVENSKYTDKGAAVVFFNNKFERVG